MEGGDGSDRRWAAAWYKKRFWRVDISKFREAAAQNLKRKK